MIANKSFIKIFYSLILISFLLALFSCNSVNTSALAEEKKDIKSKEGFLSTLTPEQKEALSQPYHGKLGKQLDSIMNILQRRFAFRGSVLVANEGVPILNKSYGYANYRERIKLTEDMPFQVASVSKQFTAVAIMMLAEEGKLHFSDTVSHIIKGFPYENVTIEQLLNHTGGLPNYMWLLEHKYKGEKATNKDVIDLMIEHKSPPYFLPGKKYDYSNTGYVVLAYIVEKISQKSFPDFMEQQIFKPLGMNHTFIYSNAYEKEYPQKVTGHYYRWRRLNPYNETIHDGVVGDKGLYSTTADLFKWDQALYSEILISNETKEKAFTPVKVRNKYEYPYGYGFRLKEKHGKKIVYHTGTWEGFKTNLMRYIEDKNTIIILNNTSSKSTPILVNKIERFLNKFNDQAISLKD